MDIKANYVAVGTFVLICALGIIAMLIWLGGAQYAEEYAYYRTYFTGSVTGLNKDTVVRYNGIEVGRVTKLEFDARDPKAVIATVQVDPMLRLRTDSVASIETLGITGGAYVEIAGGTPQAPLLTARAGQEYPIIPSRKSTLQQLSESAPQLVSKMNVVTNHMDDLLNDQNRKAFAETLANLAIVSKQLQETLQTANGAVNAFGQFSSQASTAATNFGQFSNSADEVVQDTREQLKESVAQMHSLVSESRDMVQSITRLSDGLERDPTKLLFGDRYQGYTPK